MSGIPLTRCQFVIPFADIHSEIGAPTVALLSKFRLPATLEGKANHFVPILLAIQFAEAVQRSQGITDVGFQAARRLQFCHLSEEVRRIVGHAPTLFMALQQACKWAPLEDTILNMWLEHHIDHIRICSRLAGTTGLLHLEHSQWLQNIFVIYIVRQFAGPDWSPETIAFEARYRPTQETRALWPNTRFLSGQPASWIDVPIEFLSLGNLQSEPLPTTLDDDAEPSGSELIGALKLMLPSYLDESTPSISEIAEMAGISTRSLQRKLSMAGLTYSGLLNTVRFESAAKRLRETDAKVIDIALSSGYTDPAHFTRAFRRIPSSSRHRAVLSIIAIGVGGGNSKQGRIGDGPLAKAVGSIGSWIIRSCISHMKTRWLMRIGLAKNFAVSSGRGEGMTKSHCSLLGALVFGLAITAISSGAVYAQADVNEANNRRSNS